MFVTFLVAAWALIMALLACVLVVFPYDHSDHFRDISRED